jgi:hypothetical protein
MRTVSSACTVYDEIESGTDQRQRSGISLVGMRSMSSPSAARKAASSTSLSHWSARRAHGLASAPTMARQPG